jgi:hypothetical protein
VLRFGSRLNDLAARLLRRDLRFAYVGIRMAELMSPLDPGWNLARPNANSAGNPNPSKNPSVKPPDSSPRADVQRASTSPADSSQRSRFTAATHTTQSPG